MHTTDARPTGAAEEELYGAVSAVLSRGPEILANLASYRGCGELIRKAMSTPNKENEDAAWVELEPSIAILKQFFLYSEELEATVPKLLAALSSKESPDESLLSQQALAKQLADVFDFVLRFDDLKMSSPQIQNDFAYFRRTMSRRKRAEAEKPPAPAPTGEAGAADAEPLVIKEEMANRMSLFFAYPTPMMKCLSDLTGAFLDGEGAQRENVLLTLSMMANVCYSMVALNRFDNQETVMFCLRAMTAAIVLFDHVDPQGSFHKKSLIQIRQCITTLKAQEGTGNLVNALKFTTVHLNDPDTPKALKELLA